MGSSTAIHLVEIGVLLCALHSGVARGVHVGSFAPNPCTCAPILYMCSFIVYL